MTIESFLEANEDLIYPSYEECFADEPYYLQQARDGDTTHMWEWVQENIDDYIEIMEELYGKSLNSLADTKP